MVALCYFFNQLAHLLIMRAFPINLLAGGADLEFIEIQLGQWFEPVENNFLCNWLQRMVTAQAAMERSDSGCQVEALDHFHQLLQ